MTYRSRDDTGEDKSQLLLDLLQNAFASSKFTGKAVWVGLLTSLGSATVVFGLFCVLRPRNAIIYAPKTRVHLPYADTLSISSSASSTRPPKLRPGFFAWMIQIYKMTESELFDIIGLDMTVYLMFMRMCTSIFLCLSFVGITVAIPVNVIFSLQNPSASTASTSDAFLLMTPTLVGGVPMIAHVVLAYFTDITVMLFLWRTYHQVSQLRQRYFLSSEYQNSLYARTVLITEIPKKYRSNGGLQTILTEARNSRPFEQASIGRNVTGLGKLVEHREQCVLHLEKVLSKYFKHIDSLPANRPQCKPYKGDRHNKQSKVDAIDYLVGRIQELDKQIMAARHSHDTRREMPYGFAAYNRISDAHRLVLSNRAFRTLGAKMQLAPRKEDILWDNIVLTRAERLRKQHIGNLLFFILSVAWIVPNAFIGTFLSQISRIGVLWDSFGAFMARHVSFFSFVQGFIAPAVTSAIFLILPIVMRRVSVWQGTLTKSTRERNTLRKLYSFFVFNNLFIFTIFGVAWSAITQLVELSKSGTSLTVKQIFNSLAVGKQLSSSIVGVSSFWVMYIIRVNFGSVLDLMQVTGLLVRSFARRFMAPTPRQMIRWTAPPYFEFAAHYNWLLFYVTIALTFTTIQPLVFVVTAIYFLVDSYLKKYSFVYIFVTKVESGGEFWVDLFDRVLFACSLGNLVMLMVVWTQGGWRIALGILPLFPLVVIFRIYSSHIFNGILTYDEQSLRTSFDDESTTAKSAGERTQESPDLRTEFGNPALYRRLIIPMVTSKAERYLTDIYKGLTVPDSSFTVYGSFELVDSDHLDIVRFQANPNYNITDVLTKEDTLPANHVAVTFGQSLSGNRRISSFRSISARVGGNDPVEGHGQFLTPGSRQDTVPSQSRSNNSETIYDDASPYQDTDNDDDSVVGISFPMDEGVGSSASVPSRYSGFGWGRRWKDNEMDDLNALLQ